MDDSTVLRMRQRAETLLELSTAHLSADSRRKLLADDLSVNVYASEYGGFVLVGQPNPDTPTEPDLAAIFELAARAGFTWLMFDVDADIIEGLPVFPTW